MTLSVTGCASNTPAPSSAAICNELAIVYLTASENAAVSDKTFDVIASNNEIIQDLCGSTDE